MSPQSPSYDSTSTTYISSAKLKPYLELPHYLSLAWLAYPILSLLFVAFRLQISLASAQDSIANAKDNLISSCKAAERAATSAASMPRFMALATNERFADTVNGSLNAARAALVLSLTVMEAIINFIVDLYRSTFLCFLELVIRGGLAIIIGAVKEFGDLIQNVANGLASSIQNDISSANNVIRGAIDSINNVNPFSDITPPQIPVPNLDALTNFKFPTTLQDSLTNLNSTLPTFDDIKQKLEQIIDTPFELLKKDINDTFAGMSFDRSVLPVPEQNTVSFCNDLDTSVVDDLGRDLIKTAKIGVIVIIILALVLIGLNCLLEWYKWRCQMNHLEYTRQAWMTDRTISSKVGAGTPQITLSNHNLLMLQANGSHPLITRIINQLSNRLRLSSQTQIHASWFLNYIFHAPALACFLIGFFGLLSVQIQLAALGPLQAKFAEKETQAVADFSQTIFTSINNSMHNQSATYANDVNGRVDTMQSNLNNGLFGWVNGTTTAINTTINEVYDDIQNAVNTVFNGTILQQPAQEFIRCLIGSKVDAIENALTFLHDNLKVDIPRMNQSALVLSEDHVNEATQPIAAAAVGSGGDGSDGGGIVGRLVNAYAESLKKERVMFLIFIGLWGFVCLMGVGFLLWDAYGAVWNEKRKRRNWEREQRGEVVPYPIYGTGYTDGGEREKGDGLRPLTPLEESDKDVSNKSWDNFFGGFKKPFQEGERTRTISGPMKLKAFVKDTKEVPDDKQLEPLPFPEPETKNSRWFSRFTGQFGKKQKEPEHVPSNFTSANERSQSRWSASPIPSPTTPRARIAPWVTVLSPTRKSSSATPPPIPQDVNSVYESSQVRVPATTSNSLAPPLHHGFGFKLAPAPPKHPNLSKPAPEPELSVTPVTQLLSSRPAWRSSMMNPFQTPFDDEHQVKIEQAPQRKSIPTNPFLGGKAI
ncbi:hypothetical protein E1B28_000352 [Marasmius oreades]|uniref:Plasma membrane fusion protein PRM1 n=1 Tax=Marasmius oreades TaxID=181124 RepID=A0A9P7V140_9AGAR|nr:uncharacterized protein E1B28_000352 [Marasmius oreades]KAG7098393.1 hypothetical protein E1B28_000352 [Marasmius oreades]